MKIFNEDYGFALTVGASAAIADLCPNGDLNRMTEVLTGSFSKTINFTAAFIVAMAAGYDDAQRFSGEEVNHKPLTVEMVKALPNDIFKEVQAAALSAFRDDTKTTVEVEPSKKKETPKESI